MYLDYIIPGGAAANGARLGAAARPVVVGVGACIANVKVTENIT